MTQSCDVSTFVTLDHLEITDLLQSDDSPFRLMATTTTISNTDRANRVLFPSFGSAAPPMSWESYKMIVSEWGFQLSSSMLVLSEAVGQLYASGHSFVKDCNFVFHGLSRGKGVYNIQLSLSHLTAQWNPSTVIALQRFMGRMRKATITILTNSPGDNRVGLVSPQKKIPKSVNDVVFSVKADIHHISIYLSKYRTVLV